MSSEPLVSIICVTYEHRVLIGRALDGFLSQHTNFPFEIIVHDDASKDGTVEVILDYQRRYPDKIITILQKENQRSKGIKPWPPCFEKARGKYIAVCEGDDHWLDVDKLQRQIDALEKDERATGCFTNAYNELNGVRKPFLDEQTNAFVGNTLNESQYAKGQGIPTCTFCFRKAETAGYKELVRNFASGDTALFTLLLTKGHFIYQPFFTAVRVMHAGGVYSLQGTMQHLRVALKNLPEQDKLTQGRYKDQFEARRMYWLQRSWEEGFHGHNWPLARLAWSHLRTRRVQMGWSLQRTLWYGFFVHYPELVMNLVKVKHRVFGGGVAPGKWND